jgi:TetR/AcrR family transcriptional regulator
MAIRFPASDSAITVDVSTTIVYQLVETAATKGEQMADRSTRDRILEVSLDLFGTRGVDAVSLDEIARAVGVRKQTVLYWFASKDDLVDEVLAVAAAELVIVIDAALRAAPDDPLDRIDAVVRAVFRPAVRRPALLGLIREVSRLESDQAERLRSRIQSLVDRAIVYLGAEMEAGRLRRGDPRLMAALGYATLTGIATEPEALRAVGWEPTPAGLRRLRDELRFLVPAFRPRPALNRRQRLVLRRRRA